MSDTRIEQFKNMTEADPENELGHFSLGKAYLDAGQFEEAASSLRRVLELNAEFSKAYALLGQCEMKGGRRDEAVKILQEGFQIAHERGDLMPRNEMGILLKELGVEPPEVKEAVAAPADSAGSSDGAFRCQRCKGGARMADQPMRGELGQRIFESICAGCWQEWIGMGTKVINELRLDFRSPEAQNLYDTHMKEFLGLES